MNQEKEIRFVAERYRRGRFNTDKAWGRLGIATSFKWKRFRIAVAVAGMVFLSATAAIVYRQYSLSHHDEMEINGQFPSVESPAYIVKVIDFEDTPLPLVIDKIREVYGVEVSNVPYDATKYHLSLHYEGNAMDLVETINDILDIQMAVEE